MGADGHVIIWDYEVVKRVIGHDPVGYIYDFLGRKLIVSYFGDSPPGYYETPCCVVCNNTECEDGAHDVLEEKIIVENGRLAQWEVWT